MRLSRLLPSFIRRVGRPTDDELHEFQVRIQFDLGHAAGRAELEEASARAVEAVEDRVGDLALGVVAACDFDQSEIELEFTVLAARSSDLHARVGRVVQVIEAAFPAVRERSSGTQVTQPPAAQPVPA